MGTEYAKPPAALPAGAIVQPPCSQRAGQQAAGRRADPLWFLRTKPRAPEGLRAGRWLFLLLLVLVSAATIGYFWPLLGPLLPWSGPAVSDLDLVPGEARAFLCLRLADLWQGPLRPIQANLAPLEEDLRQLVGLGPAQIERLTVILPAEADETAGWHDQAAWWLVTTVKSCPQSQVQARLAPNMAAHFCRDKTYYPLPDDPERALYFIDDRLYFLGPLAALGDLQGRPRTRRGGGRLESALGRAASNLQVVGGTRTPGGLAHLFPLASGPTELHLCQEAQSLACTWHEKEVLGLELHWQFAAAAQAQQARAALEEVQQLPARPQKLTAAVPLITALAASLATARTACQDETLTLRLERPAGGTALAVRHLLPAWQKQRADQSQTRAVANLGRLVRALLAYEKAQGHLPPAVLGRGLSWRVALLPYLGQEALYEQFHPDEPWDSPHNLKLLERMPRVFAPQPGTRAKLYSSFYQVLTGSGAVFADPRARPQTRFTDRREQTLLIVEAEREVLWTQPDELRYQPHHLPALGAQFPDLFLAAFADGSVRLLPRRLDHQVLSALITPAGGETVSLPD